MVLSWTREVWIIIDWSRVVLDQVMKLFSISDQTRKRQKLTRLSSLSSMIGISAQSLYAFFCVLFFVQGTCAWFDHVKGLQLRLRDYFSVKHFIQRWTPNKKAHTRAKAKPSLTRYEHQPLRFYEWSLPFFFSLLRALSWQAAISICVHIISLSLLHL